MSAITTWNKIVLSYRRISLNNGNHWHGDHARWYDQWVKVNNYANEIYPIYKPFVHGQVLEIGAGTGLFTQYLVNDAEQIDVLEPSADMLEFLKENVGNQQNLSLYNTTIEQFDFQDRQYNFAFAAHAFFNVMHIDYIIKKILDHCDVLGVVIGNGKPIKPFQVFRDEGLVEKNRVHPPHHMNLLSVLRECGFHYDICHLASATKYIYQSEDELLEKIASQYAILKEKKPAYLEKIKPMIRRNEQGVYVEGNREHVCLLIGKDKVNFHNRPPAK